MSFVHLRVHTEYSLHDGLVRIKPLMKTLAAQGMHAIAITDACNLFAVVKWYRAALSAGIKPIIGCDVQCIDPSLPQVTSNLVLLCMNPQGYRQLTRLVSIAYQEGQYHGQPRVHKDWVAQHAEGLIALSGGREGDIGRALLAGDDEKAYALAQHWKSIFPQRFYIEISRTSRENEERYNALAVRLADALSLPLVATNDVRFLQADDFEAHEARVCVQEGYTIADPRRVKRYQPTQYLRCAEEMVALFSDLPQAVENTLEISKRCTVPLSLDQSYLPDFPVPSGASIGGYLSDLSRRGLETRFLELFKGDLSAEQRSNYEQRLQTELDVINSMGFAGYFLIVADFIQWAKRHDIPVGPGRGSGAGSLVAYALMITDLDPLQYELLFERFLNPERVSMPDFDIDFCMDGRDRVIDYVAQTYGRQSVSQIITFGTMAAKAVIRDVGRVLGHPYGFVDQLAKLIPFEIGITLQATLDLKEELYQRYLNEEDVKELLDLALKLEGIARNAGKHAGGVVISPSALTDFTAIYCEEGSSQIVSQLDKDDVEAVGLVKFDFLGLRTLTIIHRALVIINQTRADEGLAPLAINTIPLDDEVTFKLLISGKTTAVFQLESRGMKELIYRLQPDSFEEIIALVALFRPGPLQSGMVDDFIDRKHGRASVVYPHADLEPILKPTYGVILYQEQVMQIAQVLANYTLGGADLLRRAMGKKKPEEMAKQREIFTQGAVARNVSEECATLIFDLMEKFAGYGFNKSHSAAYALIAYQTAWLKAHYPAAFMAAVMSSDLDHTDKLVGFIHDCRQLNLKVLPPSINQSLYVFSVQDEKTILYGLGAIKGVGEAAVEVMLLERNAHGAYTDLFDLCRRVDKQKVNRRVFEALIKSGSLDEFGVDRAMLTASLDAAMKLGGQWHQNQHFGQGDLFALMQDDSLDVAYTPCSPWRTAQRLDFEKETLGLYLTGHPADDYLQEWASLVKPLHQLSLSKSKHAMTCGLITSVRRIVTKRGKKLVILGLENALDRLDLVVYSEVFTPHEAWINVGCLVAVEGDLSHDEYTRGTKMTATALFSVDEMRMRFAKNIRLDLLPIHEACIQPLQALLKAHPGTCLVQLCYQNQTAQAKMTLGMAWRVTPCEALLSALDDLLQGSSLRLIY